jgi:dUTP pyrophosphatase
MTPFEFPQLNVLIKRLHPDAQMPVYATEDAGCFDLKCIDDGVPHPNDPAAKIYRTGLAFVVPRGWSMDIQSRSGHGFKYAARLSNSV